VPRWLEPMFPRHELAENEMLVYISVAAGLAGIALAWLFYVARPGLADAVTRGLGLLYRAAYNKYFVDEIYAAAVINPLVGGSREVLWKGVDTGVIDGMVNGVGTRARAVGGVLRRLQSGNIRSYAAWVLIGSVAALVAFGVTGGLR
jgi:NADH-quinone oxidoreductase subunit L